MNDSKKNTWDVLSQINVSEHTEVKNGLTYLSWAWAWGITKLNFPSANYKVVLWDGRPYLFDENLGYLIQTVVSIDGEEIAMQLPVMDGANKAQKNVKYSYQVKEWVDKKWTGKYIDKPVDAATMFDINTTIMRCLTKNLAMFGLGHYIYAKEDLPKEIETEAEKLEAKRLADLQAEEQRVKLAEKYAAEKKSVYDALATHTTVDALGKAYKALPISMQEALKIEVTELKTKIVNNGTDDSK